MKHMKFYIFKSILINYRQQRSCGQGNVLTGVCLSAGGGGCMLGCQPPPPPPDQADPPVTRQTPPGTRQTPPKTRQTPPPGPGRTPPGTRQTPPGTRQTPPSTCTPPGPDRPPPPGKQTPAYGLRAAGTHPTGMHSCFLLYVAFSNKNTIINCQLKVLGLNQPVPRNVLSKFF